MSMSRWSRVVLLVGVVYLVAGLVFGALAGAAGAQQLRVAWRLAAWATSAVAFAAHIWYEQLRLRHSSATSAFHAALAVAIGAFGLAVSASIHAMRVHKHFPASALLSWPIVTALPAFVVAFVAAAVIAWLHRPPAQRPD